MKSFLFLLLITIAYSCGSSYDLDLPSTYTSSSVEILQITAYRYTAGDYVEIPRRVGGGSLDELNPSVTVSATCEDEGCDDVSPSGYLFSSTEGQIGYIVIYNEVFTKI